MINSSLIRQLSVVRRGVFEIAGMYVWHCIVHEISGIYAGQRIVHI
jgi:hypothetical protein